MNHTKRTAEEEEEVSYEKQRLHLAEMERKANFEQTQAEVRRQKDQLQLLRRENKELKSALQQAKVASKSTSKAVPVSADGFQDRQSSLMATRTHQYRRQIDDLKTSNDEKTTEIGQMNEKIDELQREAQPILDDNSPMTQKIRMLENRLDKSLIKHNEAMAVRRTYEQILKRLRDERVGFDNQLAAIEKTLKSKEHDFMELENMAHDAKHAKELAKAEVQQFKASYAEERRQKKRELEERKAFVDAKMTQVLDQEKRKQKQQDEQQATVKQDEEERRKKETSHTAAQLRTEEEEERLRQNSEAYRRIKEATRANNVDEVCAKFNSQEATHQQLRTAISEAHERIDKLHEQKAELSRKVDEAKYSGSGQLGSRRIVDEFETHLAEARAQLEKAKKEYEEVSQTFTGVVAGVEHLAEKLSTYRPEVTAPPVTDETILDVMKVCEQKLSSLSEAVAGTEESVDEAMQTAEVEMPANNVRIDVNEREDDDDDRGRDGKEGEEGDDDPHDRIALKEMSLSAVEREAKKNRKLRKKKDDDM
eukprot:CAMPEP_0174849690 /NCGR_PEP_ID=MMETSP1114-20130205/16758_1 /TAXON_ID=312471 /ORGANISM="Neobodo designis, Strain CCAP 1951/1" /LENGTH=535 /DNA_ID=CAMNT_0016084075 /DNA_START=41 /DNA_END=1648 /DNA_ORIENTATION=+